MLLVWVKCFQTGSQYVVLIGLYLSDLPASTSQVLGLKMCDTTTRQLSLILNFIFLILFHHYCVRCLIWYASQVLKFFPVSAQVFYLVEGPLEFLYNLFKVPRCLIGSFQ